jgi:hypothetical protein
MIGYCSLGLGHSYWSLAMVIGYAYRPLAIGHRLWLLAIDIYTKKCGYGYNPFWLLPIVHGYVLNSIAIGYCKLAMVIGYWLLDSIGM